MTLPISKIVAAIDLDDDLGMAVLHTAADLSNRFSAELHVIDVWPGLTNFILATPGLPEGDQRQRYRMRKAKRQKLLEHHLKGLNTPSVAVVPIGHAGESILDYLKAANPDLLVIGSHQKTLWQRLSMGSVSSKAIHRANCAVFIVTPDFAKTLGHATA